MSEKWTVNDIPDLTGKVMIVTGGNSGIGYEAAKEFARKGAKRFSPAAVWTKHKPLWTRFLPKSPTHPQKLCT